MPKVKKFKTIAANNHQWMESQLNHLLLSYPDLKIESFNMVSLNDSDSCSVMYTALISYFD